MYVRTRLKRAMQQIPSMGRALGLVREAAPRWIWLWGILLLVQGLLPVFTVYLAREIVDRLVLALGAGKQLDDLVPVLFPLALMVAVLLLGALLQSAQGMVRTVLSQLVQDRISFLVQEQSVALDLSFYELPEYFDKLHRARSDASHRPLELLSSLGGLLQNSITLAAMAALLVPYGIWVPAALVLSTLPALYIVLDHRVRYYRWNLANTEAERRSWYYDWLLTARESAAEIRVFNLARYFQRGFARLRRRLRRESIRLYRNQALAEFGASVFALLITGLVMGWMIWRVVAGFAGMGDLALFYQAFNQGQKLMRSLLESVGQVYSNSLFLADFFEFLALRPRITDPDEPMLLPRGAAPEIRFSGVTFRYPAARKPILENFDLVLKPGRITAIVGANGAGKSTLVKLICRLYDPEAGTITFDGRALRDCAVAEVRKAVTVLFQDPVRYNATVAENICLGDIDAVCHEASIRAAALAAGVDTIVSRWPDGYETSLGRMFGDGIDLSGGEWQRIALARAFLRKSPVLVLDEPTSAMDSWSEMDWLERFRELATGRTAVIIAHRFTTAMQADYIHVMDNGRIVESGNHRDLVRAGGRYAASWQRQVAGVAVSGRAGKG